MNNPQPTDGQLEALRRIKNMEKGRESVIVKPADAGECEDRGWALKRPGGRYSLTVEGRAVLKEWDED